MRGALLQDNVKQASHCGTLQRKDVRINQRNRPDPWVNVHDGRPRGEDCGLGPYKRQRCHPSQTLQVEALECRVCVVHGQLNGDNIILLQDFLGPPGIS